MKNRQEGDSQILKKECGHVIGGTTNQWVVTSHTGDKTIVTADHRNIHGFTIHTGTMARHEGGTHSQTQTCTRTQAIIICPPFAYFR